MIALSDVLILGAIMFSLSVAGIFLNRKNVIILLMAIELMLLAVNQAPVYGPTRQTISKRHF